MLLLLEPHPRARQILTRELSRFGAVSAPELERLSVPQALAGLARCRLLACSCNLADLDWNVQLVRTRFPNAPVLFMTQGNAVLPAVDGALSVPYAELKDLLAPTVATLLQVSGEDLRVLT